MPITREKNRIRVQSFNGGEDSTSEPAVVQQNFATILRNGVIKELGKVKQREGIDRIGDNPDTLVSHYKFDASSSEDDKGSNTGVDTSIAYVDGKFGKAPSFNGTTSKITVAADSTIDITTIDDFTFTCWVFPDSDGQLDTGRIWTKGSSFVQVQNESSNTVKIRFVVDYDTTDAEVITSTTINIGEFTKLEFIHNTDNSLDIVINGVIATYSTDTTGVGSLVDDSSDDLVIGNNTGQTQTFDGEIDDFRIYNAPRVANDFEQDKIFGITRYTVGTTIDRIFRIRDTNLERLDDDFKGYTVIDSGFTADLTTNFVQAKDLLFILNGTENVHSMDSAETVTDEGNTNTDPPRTTVGAWAQNNRLFVGGSLTEAERDFIWFSDSLDPQTFDQATNVFKVRSGSSGRVTWLQTFKLNEMIIYKDDSVFVLNMTGATPLTDWTLEPVNVEVGCKAGRTVQDIGNDHVFLDNENRVRLLQRTTFDKLQTAVISDRVQSILDTINVDAVEKAASWFIDGKYYLAIPTGTQTENDVVLVWDTAAARLIGREDTGWSVIPSGEWFASVFTEFEFGDNKLRLVFGDNRTVSLTYKQSGNNDNGAAIRMRIAGQDHDLGNRGSDKIWGPLHVVWDAGESTSVEIFAEIDRGGRRSLGTLSLSGGAPVLPIDLPFDLGGSAKASDVFFVKQIGRGKTCRIEVEHDTFNVQPTFTEYELFAEERITRA